MKRYVVEGLADVGAVLFEMVENYEKTGYAEVRMIPKDLKTARYIVDGYLNYVRGRHKRSNVIIQAPQPRVRKRPGRPDRVVHPWHGEASGQACQDWKDIIPVGGIGLETARRLQDREESPGTWRAALTFSRSNEPPDGSPSRGLFISLSTEKEQFSSDCPESTSCRKSSLLRPAPLSITITVRYGILFSTESSFMGGGSDFP